MNKKPIFELTGKRIWVAGHRGMVGSAMARRLRSEPCTMLTSDRADVDLTRQTDVEAWMERNRPDAIVMAAAKVGGILVNDTRSAEFIHNNLAIETNVIHAAHQTGVKKLLFLGSSCVYPKLCPQPIKEEYLLTGPLEPTNEWYAIAKIAGIKLCQAYRRQYGADFISCMPTNLYGPGDNFDLTSSHVLPALLIKAQRAKEAGAPAMELWGSGTPRREFLHVDDLADGLVHLLKHYSEADPINIGVGKDLTIRELAETIVKVVGFKGALQFDASKPDGTPRKLLDVSRLAALSWTAKIALEPGIRATYDWMQGNAIRENC
jgi:GDP-L-fucose synthase